MNYFIYSMTLLALIVMPMDGLAQSLWMRKTTNEKGIFADRKAYRVGDLLKVVVSISSGTDKAGLKISRDEKRENSTFDNPSYFYFLKKGAKAFKINSETGDLHSTSAHKGGGELKVENIDFLSNFTVSVIDVLPNKNLVIEGARKLKIMDQVVFTTLRGIVRIDDISKNNEIEAMRIADMHLEMLTEGSITDVQDKGIVSRINDVTNLF